MDDLWRKMQFTIWKPLSSWIFHDINFATETSYETSFLPLRPNWCKSVEKRPSYGRLTDFNMAGGFLTYVNFDSKYGCMTPLSAYVSNLVQIYAKMADLWPKV